MNDVNQITTETFKETPYADEQYEIVGEPPGDERFIPLQIDLLPSDQAKTDPMFFDFGGTTPAQERFWHLPQGLGIESIDSKKRNEELAEQERLRREQEIEAARAEAFQEGRSAGSAEGEERVQKLTQEINTKVSTIIKDLAAQMQERLLQIERDAVKLTIDVIEKLVPKAVEINPEYIVPILHEALELSGTAIIKKVRVSPEDLEFIEVVGLQNSFQQFDGTWEFVADESIRAGCVVEASSGEIEYDLDKAVERTKENILKVLK